MKLKMTNTECPACKAQFLFANQGMELKIIQGTVMTQCLNCTVWIEAEFDVEKDACLDEVYPTRIDAGAAPEGGRL